MMIEPLEERRLLSTVAINTGTTYQTITALGAGLNTDGMLNAYTTSKFYDEVVNELGASGVRFAIVPSFEKANDNGDPSTFDWSRFDPNSLAPMMNVLQAMKDRGVNTFLGTVWSPPWWMKTNYSQTMGGMVRPDMYGEFAEYLSAAVLMAKSNFGIDISAMSPQNEPYFNEPYNSAVYTPEQLRELIRAVGNKFVEENLSTKIVGIEDLDFGNSRVNWSYDPILSDPEVNQDLYAITGHTYGADWVPFGKRIAPYHKPFWQTETSGESNNFAGAMAAADNVYSGLTLANASAYFYWQFSDSDPTRGLMLNGVPNQKFYTLKQFYRFIRPGMQRVDVQSADPLLKVTSFRDPSSGVLTIVAMNENTTDQNVTFSLGGANLPTLFKQYRTSATENAVQLANVSASGGKISLSMPAQSIVTLYSGPDFTATTGRVPSYVRTPPQWDPKTGRSLATAAINGDVAAVERLIAGGANVNDPGVVGWTPLDYAAASPAQGAVAIMQRLIDAGANVNARTADGLTALQIAAMNSGFEKYHVSYYAPSAKFDVLVKSGADVNAADNFGRTALHFAAMNGRVLDIGLSQDPSEVNALLLEGANPNLDDVYGETAMDYAVAAGYLPQAAALRAAMGDTMEQPFRGSPIPVQTGKLTFEAEDFDFGGAGVAYVDSDPTNTGGQYRPGAVDIQKASDTYETYEVTNAHPGEWLKYTASFTNPGTYDLSFRVASATGGGTFHLEVDRVDKTGELTIPNTGGDETWADVPVTGISLAAGTHILRLVFDTAPTGASIGNFNSITLDPKNLGPAPGAESPFNGAPFPVSQSTPVTIEAEQFDNGGEGVAYHDVDGANQGGKFRDTGVDIENVSNDAGSYDVGWTRSGEWLRYTIDVADAGKYDLGFRVASQIDGATFHAAIDGVDTGIVIVPNTGGWQNWETLSTTGVTIGTGQHILQLFVNSSNGPNFNYVTISATGTQPPPPPPPSGQGPFGGTAPAITSSGTTTIQAEDFDSGGEGIAYHDTDGTNLGNTYRTSDGVDIQAVANDTGAYNVGWTKAGEWMEYTINVVDAGSYDLGFRAASAAANGAFHAEIDGSNVTGSLAVPNTGDWQTWQTITKTAVNLTAGQHVLRLAMDANDSVGFVGNFNYVAISPSTTQPPPPPPGGQTPYGGTPVAIDDSGLVTIQTENFDEGGEGVAYHDTDTTNQGGKYRSTGVDIESTGDSGGGYDIGYAKAGEWLEYTINVADGGTYDLGFRVASASANGAFHAEIDGVDVTGSLAVPNTGGWQSWQTVSDAGASLAAGQHVLRIAMDANGSSGYVGNFNSITISPSGSVQPPPPPSGQAPYGGTAFVVASSGTSTLQAENFDDGGEGVAYHDSDGANSGSKYRDTGVDIENVSNDTGSNDVGWVEPGEWLEYTINVAAAGNYDLGFRVASTGSNGAFHAEIDDGNVTGTMTVPNTGGWQSWTTVSKNGVALGAGQHVLRLSMDGAGTTGVVGNFNYITFAPSNPTPQPTTITSAVSTYVRDGSYAGSNYGSTSTLLVKKYTSAGTNRESYLKFDLSGVATINSAKLRLYGHLSADNGPVQVGIYSSSNTTWNENTLTWNTRFASANTPVATLTLNSTTAASYEVDLTNFLQTEKDVGHDIVTIALKGIASATPVAIFNSDDAGSNQPRLVIT